MRFCRPLFVIIFLSVLFSCSNRQMSACLNEIESYIEERPDSALNVLESIPVEFLNSDRLKARHSLLYAMALDKNYIDTTDINIIEPAIRYYEKYGTADEKLKCYYYQGIAYFNKKEYDNAIMSFSYAEDMIYKAKDMRYIGLLYSRISDLCNRTYNSDDEIKYIDLASKIFTDNKINKYFYSTLERKGQALFGVRKYDEAEKIFLDLINSDEIPRHIKNTAKEDYAVLLVAKPERNPVKALTLFGEVLSDVGTLRDLNIWASYAYSLASCGHTKESAQVFSQLYKIECQNYSVIDIWRSAACESEGNFHDALSLLQKSLYYQDSLLNVKLSQTTAKAQMNFIKLKSSQTQMIARNRQIRLMVIIIFLVLFLVASYLIYHNRSEILKKERVELAEIAEAIHSRLKESEEKRTTETSSLRSEIEIKENTLSALRSEYSHMYKSQFKYLGNLCETFLLANERTDSQRIVYEKVQEMIKDISSDKEGQKRFEKMIDGKLDNIMKLFREEFPKYSEEDYRFISYIFVGFDATTLCIIFNMPSVASVYMKKSRIKKAIQESNSSFRGRFLDMMG